jgi:hypothetical protein
MKIEALTIPNALQAMSVRPADANLARDFEAMLLAPMVDAMLPDAGAVFGEGPGADVWRSQLATAIASAMGERGVLGLGEMVFGAHNDKHLDMRT